jgi:predicted nucleic acid-binding protein
MKILIDTDILLDVALSREPYLKNSSDVLRWVENGGQAAVAWHTLTNLAYILKSGGRKYLTRLLQLVEVAPVGTSGAKHAMALSMNDIEDAFQVASALAWKADFIVTRNTHDFRHSPVAAISPAEFLKRVG